MAFTNLREVNFLSKFSIFFMKIDQRIH